jgi:hypothetical protein
MIMEDSKGGSLSMKGHLFVFFLFTLVLSLISCSKGNVKLTEDATRIRGIDHLVEEVRKSYLQRDEAAMLAHISLKGAGETEALEERLHDALIKLQPVVLEFYPERILLEKEGARVYLHWEGEWRDLEHRVPFFRKGDAIFSLDGAREPRLVEIRGDSPFDITRGAKP